MRVLLALLLVGCIDEIDPRWTLDHDHVIAARATPPRVRDGETVRLDALVAHEGRAPTIETPMTAELVAPEQFGGFVRTLSQEPDGAWRLEVPQLIRTTSGPMPVDVVLTFRDASPHRASREPFKVKKTVWVGEPTLNPVAPGILVDGMPITDEVVIPHGRDVYIEVADVPEGMRVNWLTNVGTLFQDDVPRAFVRATGEERANGELVLVVRDDGGGVDWRVLPMRVE